MNSLAPHLLDDLRTLPPEEKLRLVDCLLADLDQAHPDVEREWFAVAQQRNAQYEQTQQGYTFKDVFGVDL